jgi:hypothetical protein
MCGHDYVLCICVVETCMWMWMNSRILRLMCCVLKFKSGHGWVYDQLYVDKIVFCVLLWMRLVCGCEWTTMWLGFVYCEFFRLQLPFPINFELFCSNLSVFDIQEFTGRYPFAIFPVYRFRPNKKLCGWKRWEVFSDYYRSFSPLALTIWSDVTLRIVQYLGLTPTIAFLHDLVSWILVCCCRSPMSLVMSFLWCWSSQSPFCPCPSPCCIFWTIYINTSKQF